MAEQPVPLSPVFLSASVPDPERDRRYFETGDSVAIRDAVIALVTVVLPRTGLVFGGHPAITPLVKWVADRLGAFHRVRMFQSKFFQDRYIRDIEVFRYVEVDARDRAGRPAAPNEGDREASLLEMRKVMLAGEPVFSAAFFIGGMEGVEREYEMVKGVHSGVPRFPVATTGAAARFLWQREWELRHELPSGRQAQLEQLRTRTSYVALFTDLLGPDSASQPRAGAAN